MERLFNAEVSLTAHASIFPTWEVERVGLSGYTATKGALTIRFGHYPSGSRAVVQSAGSKRPLYKGTVTSTVEEALLDVKSYLDTAFPGMS